MQSKSLLIAIAAFALTTSGALAYSGNSVLERANISAEQKTAITRAKELKEEGNLLAARDSLVQAGVDEDVLKKLHEAKHQVEREMQAALIAGDFESFMATIADTPLADIVTSEADFEQFRSAQAMKDEGDFASAREKFAKLGVSTKHSHHGHGQKSFLQELTLEQKEAFGVAKRANDKATMQAILAEAGIEKMIRH